MEVWPVLAPGFCLVLAGMSANLCAVGSAGQEGGDTEAEEPSWAKG